MAQRDNLSQRIALQAHLAEYEGIWGEIHVQIEAQNHLLNYVIALIAASAALFSIGSPAIAERFPVLILVASLLLLAMAWALLDASFQLNDLGTYIDHVLRPKIQTLIGDDNLPHLQVLRWNRARIYGGARIFLKALLATGKFAFAYVPGIALVVAFVSLRSSSQVRWTSLETVLFSLALFMAAVPIVAGAHNAIFIGRRGASLFSSTSGDSTSESSPQRPNPA
jgi:hypothetical protein